MVLGPKYSYFLEVSKLTLIVSPKRVELAKELARSQSFKVTTGSRYLGEFIREKGAQTEFIRSKVKKG